MSDAPRRRNRSRRPRKDSRTIPRRGDGDDSGVWYTCWYCGFVCNEERDTLGGPESKDGSVQSEYVTVATGATPGDPESAIAVLDSDLHFNQVAMKSDSSGDAILPTKVYDVSQGTGCPQCSSKNWRGDF